MHAFLTLRLSAVRPSQCTLIITAATTTSCIQDSQPNDHHYYNKQVWKTITAAAATATATTKSCLHFSKQKIFFNFVLCISFVYQPSNNAHSHTRIHTLCFDSTHRKMYTNQYSSMRTRNFSSLPASQKLFNVFIYSPLVQ